MPPENPHHQQGNQTDWLINVLGSKFMKMLCMKIFCESYPETVLSTQATITYQCNVGFPTGNWLAEVFRCYQPNQSWACTVCFYFEAEKVLLQIKGMFLSGVWTFLLGKQVETMCWNAFITFGGSDWKLKTFPQQIPTTFIRLVLKPGKLK